ncbi:MAG: anaerobic ribonucleoside-triphosphate reductase activating protein [Lachnospiraceae bacterium]|nr:anaerobic ribonucleoside-triphosphate reductase activating protein [Lachnospiraceae bacterium]MBR1853654.1 anaerobic ribonucleoside-triphosphate reductase activating protein [Lachnospiraceae bacterium]
MNYASMKKTDVANGPGIRVSLFVSGCTRGCKGCFNREAWDFSYGTKWSEASERELLAALAPDHIRGLSVLGGEPFEPANVETVADIICKVRERYPAKDIWCYSGGVYETELGIRAKTEPAVAAILEHIDVLVDGPFVEEQKDLRLAFRGSANQRILNMEEVRKGNIVNDKNYQ